MTITINYSPKPDPAVGYVPRKSQTVHNVDRVVDAGPNMVRVHFIYHDEVITHDHVVSAVVIPEREE